jgi:hypothetical protein
MRKTAGGAVVREAFKKKNDFQKISQAGAVEVPVSAIHCAFAGHY